MIVLKVTYWSYVFSLFVKMSGLHSSSNVLLQSSPPAVAASSSSISSSSSSSALSAQACFLWLPPPLRTPSGLPTSVRGAGGLDNGVPVKVVLDVVGGHAMHLEVPSGYHVLLVHLCVVSLTNKGRRRRRRASSETVSPLKEV